MDAKQIRKGLQKLVSDLPEYELSDDLLIAAVRDAVDPVVWINATPDERTDMKRDLYRALRDMVDVEDISDRLIREDLEDLDRAITALEDVVGKQRNTSTVIPWVMGQISTALDYIKKARAR